MLKLRWEMRAAVFAAITALTCLFSFSDKSIAAEDTRTPIFLSGDERSFVLAEMREFLVQVQAITEALAENDMNAISTAGRSVGIALARTVPDATAAKLPEEFRTLAMATHKAFDEIAMEADTMGDSQTILVKLGEQLLNCTTCHGIYRIEIE